MNDVVQLMVELATLAIKNGDFDNSRQIFEALSIINPDDAIGCIGIASISLAQGNIDGAMRELETNGINKAVNADEAQKLRLVTAMLSGDNAKAERVHEEFIMNNISPAHEHDRDEHLKDAQTFFGAKV